MLTWSGLFNSVKQPQIERSEVNDTDSIPINYVQETLAYHRSRTVRQTRHSRILVSRTT